MSKALGQQPEIYAQNRFVDDETIRAFSKWNYRVTYQINEITVDILQVEHTSQKPNDSFD